MISDRAQGKVRVIVGVAGARRNAAVALVVNGALEGFCEQERISRVRNAGLAPGTLPAEALQVVLEGVRGLTASNVDQYAIAEDLDLPVAAPVVRFDHHHAHAAAAFGLSSCETAVVLVCDRRSEQQTSVWLGTTDELERLDAVAPGSGFAALYSEATRLFGYPRGNDHQLEALARFEPDGDPGRFTEVIRWRNGGLEVSPEWGALVTRWLGEDGGDSLRHRAKLAAGFQRHLGSVLLCLLRDVRAVTGAARLCLAGGLFYNTSLATLIQQSGLFDEVFVPPNPGNAGTAIGAALLAAERGGARRRSAVSPFLGPSYDLEETKRTLDNCKLSYECSSEREVVDLAARALAQGHLVGWFQGRMEWGHRALGNRSILANPMSPYVLDNLNVFLKHRERHRAYGVSTLEERAAELFDGPPASRFMEFEYRPRDRARFAGVMPEGTATIRLQTVPIRPGDEAIARFRWLHQRVGELTGVPVLVNTSFNGFAEPIVCSPRDAIRVFYGTGLDMLVLDRFVLRK